MWAWAPTLALLVPLYVTAAVLWFWLRRSSAAGSGKRNPLTKDLLRAAGESLRGEIDSITWDLAVFLGLSGTPLLAGYAYYISVVAFTGAPPSMFITVFLTTLAITLQVWLYWKIWVLLQRRRLLVLGYEAEVAVGQELNQLLRRGFHVFHDLPANEFNVDHVLVGPTGIFAIETKGRPKPMRQHHERDWEVSYDGETLQFPGWRESKPLQQAARQAKWLGEWLSSATGERLVVQPALVLPGWYIRRTSAGGVPVLTGRQVDYFFSNARTGAVLDGQLIQRVVHQLDQRCRDVVPRAYRRKA